MINGPTGRQSWISFHAWSSSSWERERYGDICQWGWDSEWCHTRSTCRASMASKSSIQSASMCCCSRLGLSGISDFGCRQGPLMHLHGSAGTSWDASNRSLQLRVRNWLYTRLLLWIWYSWLLAHGRLLWIKAERLLLSVPEPWKIDGHYYTTHITPHCTTTLNSEYITTQKSTMTTKMEHTK